MRQLVSYVKNELARLADDNRAKGMAAYMKTDMPFYGVQKPLRQKIENEIKRRFELKSRSDYKDAIESLWALPHREEKYLAIRVARIYPEFVTIGSIPFYRRLIISGAWWDLVDETAIHLVGRVLLNNRESAGRVIDRWIDDGDLWIRRTSIICQVSHKKATDKQRLFDTCLRRAHEKDFFIRKAVGWALRDYAWTNPAAVRRFLRSHGDALSPLSRREAAKNLST